MICISHTWPTLSVLFEQYIHYNSDLCVGWYSPNILTHRDSYYWVTYNSQNTADDHNVMMDTLTIWSCMYICFCLYMCMYMYIYILYHLILLYYSTYINRDRYFFCFYTISYYEQFSYLLLWKHSLQWWGCYYVWLHSYGYWSNYNLSDDGYWGAGSSLVQ